MDKASETTAERYEKGRETLLTMVGEEGAKAVEGFRDIFPDFEQILVAFGFGDIYSRGTFDLRQREMLTITSLITQGAMEQLPFHLHGALNVGLKPNEILEIILHCAAYSGFPKACGALNIAKEVFKQRGEIIDKA
jgi:4-carboxymuconolactone decarboxylase